MMLRPGWAGGAILVCALIGARRLAPAQEPGPGPAERSRAALELAQEDLSALRFEKALAGIQALLAEPALPEEDRVSALVLRSQVHVARGSLDAAVNDYREILAIRPGFVPAQGVTSTKAMARFEKVQKSMVGSVRLALSPPDARVSVDGREVRPGQDGVIAVLAGARVIAASRRGFDPAETQLEVVAGRETELRIELDPNARSIVVRTEPDEVGVRLDGVDVGSTVRPRAEGEQSSLRATAELVIDDVPLGEHVITLVKRCYRQEQIRDILAADLMDPSPKAYGPVVLSPLRGRLVLRGGPAGAQILVDGSPAGRLPVEPLSLCPGPVSVQVRSGGRTAWREEAEVAADAETVLDVTPRPNAALVGASDWPPAWTDLAASFNRTTGLALPSGVDLGTPSAWETVNLPPDTDLALAVVPGGGGQALDQWILYSPILGIVDRPGADLDLRRPVWRAAAFGLRLADSRVGGTCSVVEITPDGPAARAGIHVLDRILAIGGRQVTSARQAVEALAAHSPGEALRIELASPSGTRTVNCTGSDSPLLLGAPRSPSAAAVRAAWAAADAAVLAEERASDAWANLALLLSRSGRNAQALEAWKRVTWAERAGIGAGTRAYHLGREMAAIGEDASARREFRVAADSRATAFRDDGPEIAPAAEDHLADLGEAPRSGNAASPRSP